MKKNIIDLIAWILVIVGALNWGLFGLLDFDLVDILFGSIPIVSTIVYSLIGISALWMIYAKFGKKKK